MSPQFTALVRQFVSNGDSIITRAEWLQAFRKLMVNFPGGVEMDAIVKRYLSPEQISSPVSLT